MLSVKYMGQFIWGKLLLNQRYMSVHLEPWGLLTYMSIRVQINGRIAEGRLHNLEPVLPSDPVERTMLISAEINSLLIGPWPNANAAKRFGELRADLEAFVKGEKVAVCLDP
jgi:hypothetical protein